LKVIRDLTINRVTKEVWLDGDGPTPPMKDPRGNAHVGASATTQIKRQDSGVSSLPGMIGDDVTIVIDLELVEPSGKPPPRRLSKRN
jgi:polyisoprenoid-binding protein YceI